jgi:hypothetical protein
MGRPIGKRYIGANRTTDAGGEGISSFTYTNRGSNYSQGLTATAAVSPIGGIRAVIVPVVNTGNGRVDSVSITTTGTGYLTAPAITFNKPANVNVTGTNDAFWQDGSNIRLSSTTGIYVGMFSNVAGKATVMITNVYPDGNIRANASYGNVSASTPIAFGDLGASLNITAVLAAAVTTGNTIQANAWVGTTESCGNIADIVAQKGSRRYRVTNSVTTGVCTLVANAAVVVAGGPRGAGEMTITATESTGGTYFVYKLDSRTATIWQGTGTQFANLAQVPWSMNAAVANVSVKITTND